MPGFSDVDRAQDPQRLIGFLDHAAAGETGIKHYAAATHAARRPAKPVLDIGCGAGHDVDLLTRFGLRAVGVDPSELMLAAAVERTASADGAHFVRATGEALPFRSGAFAGCRIERVLMHSHDPAVILAEAVRCVEPGGLVTGMEPDWTRFEVASDVLPGPTSWLPSVRHPGVGGRLWHLLEQAGCRIRDRVEELSVWTSIQTLVRVTGFPASVERAVSAGRVDRADAQQWVAEQRRRAEAGEFRATLPKVLVVAETAS